MHKYLYYWLVLREALLSGTPAGFRKKKSGRALFVADLFIPTFYFLVFFPGIKKLSFLIGFWTLLSFAVFPDFLFTVMASDCFFPTFLNYET